MPFKFFYIAIAITLSTLSYSQNLVSNGNLELYTNGYCSLNFPLPSNYEIADGWFDAVGSGTGSTADGVCNPNVSSLFGPLPLNPPSGSGAMGFGSASVFPAFSEAVKTTLLSTINSGDVVTISLSVSPRNGGLGFTAVNDPLILFGVYFYNTDPIPTAGNITIGPHLSATPQVVIPTTSFTFGSWSSYTTTYTAPANFTKVAIGFFNPSSNSTTVQRYFAIDDISITVCPPAPTGTGGNSSVCGSNPFTFPSRTCSLGTLRWYENNTGTGSFYTGATVIPTTTTTYYPFCFTTCLSSPGNPATATHTCPVSGSGTTWIWTGCSSTDWFNSCNWDRGSVPTVSSNVIVPNTTNKPLISGGTANCYDITVQSSTGAQVNLNSSGGGILNVTKP